jgi:hypothetical protein
MNLQTQPSDDDSNGANGRDPDPPSSSDEDDDCLSQPSENGAKTDDGSLSDTEKKCANCRKLAANVKRLQKLLKSKTAFVTRLKNQKRDLVAHHTARLLSQKGVSANLKMQLTNERSSRNQIKSVLRTEYLTEIKATKELERASVKRAQLADRATDRLRGEYESLEKKVSSMTTTLSTYRQNICDGYRDKQDLKKANKGLEKDIKEWRKKSGLKDDVKLAKQLEIEAAKTERAKLEANARSSKESKRLKEIALTHESKIELAREQARLRTEEKTAREKAKVHSAAQKQKDEMKKLDSSVAMYHGSTRMVHPNGGAFPGGAQLLQVRLLLCSILFVMTSQLTTFYFLFYSYYSNNNRCKALWLVWVVGLCHHHYHYQHRKPLSLVLRRCRYRRRATIQLHRARRRCLIRRHQTREQKGRTPLQQPSIMISKR